MYLGRKLDDLTGLVFGKLTVISQGENYATNIRWNCICSCGKEALVRSSRLRSGETKSCGCTNPGSRKHGHSPKNGRSKVYTTWTRMISRCYDVNNSVFERYGGRGITVCLRWRESFESFLEDMGNPPTDKHSIDRIDVNKNYEPENCRWSTSIEQARNRRIKSTNSSGVTGVYFNKKARKWIATIWVERRKISLGRFNELYQAEIARKLAEKEYWGESS